jgi:hypothetical protein
MDEFVRILFAQPVPRKIEDWLKTREHTDWVSNGIMDENFKIIDLLFEHPEDAVQFKLTFPDVVMTREEVKICDAKQTWPVDLSAVKARLYDTKWAIYEKMYAEEPDE